MFGDDFPRDLPGFEKRFSEEEECRKYLFKLKWPEGFICPACGCGKFWWTGKHKLHCTSCGHQASVTVDTVIENSKKPLTLWFQAIFFAAFQKTGISAKGLQRLLGLGSYQTAWTWLQKIRRSMVKEERQPLGLNCDAVEADETYLGGSKPGKRGRGAEGKIPLAIAVETTGEKQMGRIRISVIDNCGSRQLNAFLSGNVAEGAIIRTDDWSGYLKVGVEGFVHEAVKASDKLLKSVHLVASLFKRWLLGTHQGSASPKYLQRYADEFVFRFNRRKSKERSLVCHRLLEQVAATKATTYRQIVGRESQT